MHAGRSCSKSLRRRVHICGAKVLKLVEQRARLVHLFGILEQASGFWHGCTKDSVLKQLITHDLLAPGLHQRLNVHIALDPELFCLILHLYLTLPFRQLLFVAGLGSFDPLEFLQCVGRDSLLSLFFGQLASLSLVLYALMRQNALLHLLRDVHIYFAFLEQVLLFVQQGLCIFSDLG